VPAWRDRWRPSNSAARAEFIGLNLGYLVARLNVAPGYAWDTERDVGGIAAFYRHAVAASAR
jgi:hypothetical protein